MPIKTPFYPLLIASAFLILMLSQGCRPSSQSSHTIAPMKIERLDLLLSTDSTLPDRLPVDKALDLYFAVLGADTLQRSDAFQAVQESRAVRVFGPDIISRLGSLDSVEISLGYIKEHIDSGIFPGLSMSQVLGIISPYRQSVIVSDSVILVALNHYLGSDYAGYAGLPLFQREKKIKNRIPLDVAEAMIRINYPYEPINGTLIEHLLYEGAVTEAMSRLTAFPEYSVLGHSASGYNELLKKEADIWQFLAANDLLYSTTPSDISRLIDPAPYTAGLPFYVPGQAGSFIGHQILKQYLSHEPEKSIDQLLDPDFYSKTQDILISSGYSPVKQ